MEQQKEYRNYIFDLYGTLVDIWTDEHDPKLWDLLAGHYRVYGSDWTGEDLCRVFFEMDREERKILGEKIGTPHPEIRLERVFSRLLLEAKDTHEACGLIAGKTADEIREDYKKDPEKTLETVSGSEWCYFLANLFRVASTKRLRLYENTEKVLKTLHERGKKVYLLSNAQRIFTWPEIEILGLPRFFDRMYISSDHCRMKPDPEYMEILLKNEGLRKEDSVMVGNEIRSDIGIAVKCGMDSILLNTNQAKEPAIREELEKLLGANEMTGKVNVRVVFSGDIGEILN